jgi:hypothetical protein
MVTRPNQPHKCLQIREKIDGLELFPATTQRGAETGPPLVECCVPPPEARSRARLQGMRANPRTVVPRQGRKECLSTSAREPQTRID